MRARQPRVIEPLRRLSSLGNDNNTNKNKQTNKQTKKKRKAATAGQARRRSRTGKKEGKKERRTGKGKLLKGAKRERDKQTGLRESIGQLSAYASDGRTARNARCQRRALPTATANPDDVSTIYGARACSQGRRCNVPGGVVLVLVGRLYAVASGFAFDGRVRAPRTQCIRASGLTLSPGPRRPHGHRQGPRQQQCQSRRGRARSQWAPGGRSSAALRCGPVHGGAPRARRPRPPDALQQRANHDDGADCR